MDNFKRPRCAYCGADMDLNDLNDPNVIISKQKKPGGTVYLHIKCHQEEQEEHRDD